LFVSFDEPVEAVDVWIFGLVDVEAMTYLFRLSIAACLCWWYPTKAEASELLLKGVVLHNTSDVSNSLFVLVGNGIVKMMKRSMLRWVAVRGCVVNGDAHIDIPTGFDVLREAVPLLYQALLEFERSCWPTFGVVEWPFSNIVVDEIQTRTEKAILFVYLSVFYIFLDREAKNGIHVSVADDL
jgi:hypothetical protein